MTEPEIRRASDPRVVRKIHSAIKKTCEQKQCPIFDRILRALSIDKVQISRSKLEIQLKHAIKDGLVIENSGNRGKGFGESKTSYRVPSLENFYENYEDDGHDWYCWICHREGEVYLCSRCPRVIHKKCAELTQEELQGDFVCYCCNDLDSTKQYGKKEIQELATMLSFTVDRMKSKCEELWKSPDEEVHPTYKLYVYQDINLNELEKRVKKKEFDSLAKFHYEIEWLFHNAVIYFGGDNKLTDLARMVVLDGQNELSQIDICSECYVRSNERMKNWFSIPCKPPHRIVYAKLGSDPPWPAKALRDSEDGQSMDVRFFGQPHQRAWIPKRNIWDLDEKPAAKKRSKALSQAEDELKIYLRLLTRGPKKEKDTKSGTDSSEEEIDDDSDDDEEEAEDTEEEKYKPKQTSSAKSKKTATSSGRGRGRPRLKREEEEFDSEDDEDDEDDERDSDDEDDDDDDYDEYEPSSKRRKKKDREKKQKHKRENNEKKKRGRKKGSKNKPKADSLLTGKETKAERRFRELQEKKMMEFQKNKVKKGYKDEQKVDINKNVGSDGGEEPSDMQLAQQIKMTDDYKMIEKLQDRVRNLEKYLEQTRSDYESAQADLESTRIDLATEKQKCKRLQEQVEKGAEINEEKLRNTIMIKKQEELDQAVEEERKRNELEFSSRMNEALADERSKCETKFQENLEKERINQDNKSKMLVQREREEMQRNIDRFKSELELKHTRNVEKMKMESDEMMKRTLQDNMRRLQAETERILVASKKKSWCSNCTKEAFYHCCWNTNYCSTDCQRVHWVTHRYQCTREMMSTCRSCQQRQNFPGSFASQVPPK